MARLRTAPRSSLTKLIVAQVVLVTVACGVLLWMLSRMPTDKAHTAATERLIAQGTELTRYLGGMKMLRATNRAALVWMRLPFVVDGLHSAQSGLQYVEISRDGVTLFHRQTGAANEDGVPPMPPTPEVLEPAAAPPAPPVEVSRKWVERFGQRMPVVVFRQELPQPDGSVLAVEVGMRREALQRYERSARQAVRFMFHLALFAMAMTVGLCVTILVWAMRRERRFEAHRRQEEHLVFSGMVANGIVHDFRNPMSAVRLDAQMLAREVRRTEGARPERLIELAERIGHTLDRLDGVFKEFLFLAKPATAAVELFDLKRCAAECIATLTSRLEQVRQRATLEAPTTPALVRASEAALRRAIINVVFNAIQHAPADSTIELAICA
ncbi:MAG: histidine kinase dimerization/phospho-acceptor domain-containing protein, partial [Kiritimatiellae bacterium]|nr:histidine kinase dimerization/phospho-acceptor domain-containing protein [Kiritimatiellia bacterium]